MLYSFISDLPIERWKEYRQLRLQALSDDPEAFARSYEEDSTLPEAAWKNYLTDALQKKSYMVFAQDNGKLVGMVGALLSEGACIKHRATIISMFVVQEYRNKGIGKRLLKELLDLLEEDPNVIYIQLTVKSDNLPAIKLYESFGFRLVGVLDKYVIVNGKFIQGALMTKILNKKSK